MKRDWHRDVETHRPTKAAVRLPAMVEEAGWDILLALHRDRRRELTFAKLAVIASLPRQAVGRWLSLLEDQRLIAATRPATTDGLRAVVTADGRDLLDRYMKEVKNNTL